MWGGVDKEGETSDSGVYAEAQREDSPMWQIIPSLASLVEQFRPLFTAPSFQTHCAILLGWIMCLGPRTLLRVFLSSACPSGLHDFSGPHGLDSEYNFFERSAWSPS